MIALFLQAWIVLTGGCSVWMTTNPVSPRHHHVGCWIGLAGQPAWVITTWENVQWGILLLNLILTISFIRGIRRHRRRLRNSLKAIQQ